MEQASLFEEQGLLDSALAAFGLALEENPNLTSAHMGMGNIYRVRGNYELASHAYQRAAISDPRSYEAHYYWGLMQQLMGKLPEAVKIYLQAVALNPTSLEANEHLASAYLQLGDPASALPYAKRAAELGPQSYSAWSNLATTYNLLGRYDDAVGAYRQAVDLAPPANTSPGEDPAPLLLGLAQSHIQLGHYDRAVAVLESLIRRKPSSTAYERLGYSQFKQRQFDNALASFRAALSLDASDPAALNGLGVALMTLYIQGGREVPAQRDEALQAWRKSVQLRADQPRIIDLIARYQRL